MIENYEKIADGHWYQKCLTGPIPVYDRKYSEKSYDVYKTTDTMSKLRFNLIEKKIGKFSSVCDFGYGNGSFLKYCNKKIIKNKKILGHDISDYPIPEGVLKIENPEHAEVDIMTFFDSIEHLFQKDLSLFLKSLNIKNICISVPWMHETQGPEFFKNWKHRRENEHIHHFDCHGLINLLILSNFKIIHVGNDEDKIRKSSNNLPNILTIIGKK